MRGNRKTTRYSNEHQHPDLAICIRKKLANILSFPIEPKPGYKDGIVASYAMTGDTCFSHCDPVWHDHLITVHCNVIVKEPENGGDLVVNGDKYEMPLNQFICYPVSELAHETTAIFGNSPRVMWVFGFCVEKDNYLTAMENNE